MNDADKLRKNFAEYLARAYILSPLSIAKLCDERLDRTGKLLGFVRDEAYKITREESQQSSSNKASDTNFIGISELTPPTPYSGNGDS